MSSPISYNVSLLRPAEVWRDFEVSYRNIKVAYRGGQQHGLAMLARQIIAAGNTIEGSVIVTEIGVKEAFALKYTLPSLHLLASLPERNVASDAATSASVDANADAAVRLSANAHDVLTRLIADGNAWSGVPGRSRGFMFEHDLVTVEGDVATVTDRGRELHAAFVGNDTGISASQQEALDLLPLAVGDWNAAVHHLTRKSLFDREWVAVQDGIVVKVDTEIAALAPVTKEAPVNVKWVAMLARIKQGVVDRREWEDLHGNTKSGFARNGLVTVSSKGKPTLTPDGEAYIGKAH